VIPRYFTPMGDSAQPASAAKAQPGLRLRLGRIDGLSHLREPMVVRTSPEELTYREEQRWTERPEVYLRAELAEALFQQRGVTEVILGHTAILDAELVAFEEVPKPQDKVRVQVVFTLRDDRQALAQESIFLEQAVADAKGDEQPVAVVAAYRLALRAVVNQLADRVVAKLGELPADK
jgi:ABC-type uncharacterized transport system auxiliary subunit